MPKLSWRPLLRVQVSLGDDQTKSAAHVVGVERRAHGRGEHTGREWSLSCRVDNGQDEPLFRQRAEKITSRHAQAIVESVHELRNLGLAAQASAQVRISGEPPRFKMYVVNGEEAFFGYYAVAEHTVALGGAPVAMFDLMGKDTELFHFALSDGPDSTSAQFVQQSSAWFDAVWDNVAREVA